MSNVLFFCYHQILLHHIFSKSESPIKDKFSTTEILRNSEIVAELKQGWQDSEPNVSGGHEEDGFIVVDDFGFLSVARWVKGTQNEIILSPHRNCFVNGKDIVASFHTHPNTGKNFQQEPSLTDVRAVRDDFDLKGEFYLGEFVARAGKCLFDRAFGLV